MMTGPDLLGILRIILLLLIMLTNEDNDIDDVMALNIIELSSSGGGVNM